VIIHNVTLSLTSAAMVFHKSLSRDPLVVDCSSIPRFPNPTPARISEFTMHKNKVYFVVLQ